MNCTEARSALALGSARVGDLARHLLECPRCAAAARIDDCVDDARAWLVSEAPPRLDVRARVLARI